jgi:hypothetical protein
VLEEGFLGPFGAVKWPNLAMKCTFTFAAIITTALQWVG